MLAQRLANSDSCCVVSRLYNHDYPLRHTSVDSLAKAILVEWYANAAYLAAHITLEQLEMALVCNVHHAGARDSRISAGKPRFAAVA